MQTAYALSRGEVETGGAVRASVLNPINSKALDRIRFYEHLFGNRDALGPESKEWSEEREAGREVARCLQA